MRNDELGDTLPYRILTSALCNTIAGVAELVDAQDLKSCVPKTGRAGSIPVPGTGENL